MTKRSVRPRSRKRTSVGATTRKRTSEASTKFVSGASSRRGKLSFPIHADIDIPIYRQRFLFLVEKDIEPGYQWIEKTLGSKVARSAIISEESVNAAAFGLERNGDRAFVVWLKSWDSNAKSYGRLAHECLHATIQILAYINYCPRLRPRFSEPICYLHDSIMRLCVEQIYSVTSHAR